MEKEGERVEIGSKRERGEIQGEAGRQAGTE